MEERLITFLSQTSAYRFLHLARENGVAARLTQTPKELSRGGCSYAAVCDGYALKSLMPLVRKNGISFSRIFVKRIDRNGKMRYEEIR